MLSLRERASSMGTPLRWLQQWRQHHELTQAEAALLFGVHHITYAKWEVGMRALEGSALRLATLYRDRPYLVAEEAQKWLS